MKNVIVIVGLLIASSSFAMQQDKYSLRQWMGDGSARIKVSQRRPTDEVVNFFSLGFTDLDGLSDVTKKDKVTHINVSGNKVSNLPWGIKQFPALEELDLTDNKFKQVNFNLLADLQNLRQLLLYNNQIEKLVQLPKIPNLKHLGLANNKISEIVPNAFSNVPQLEILQLNGNKLTKFDPALIKDLKNLKVLDLSGNPLSEDNKKQLLDNKPNPILLIQFNN